MKQYLKVFEVPVSANVEFFVLTISVVLRLDSVQKKLIVA